MNGPVLYVTLYLGCLVAIHGRDIPNFVNGSDPASPPDSSDILWHKNSFNTHDPLDGFKSPSTGHFDEGSLSVVKDPAGGHGNVLKVYVKKGHYIHSKDHRGAQFYSHVVSPRDSMTLSYEIYFQHGMDFVKGGKLPGLYGGELTCSGGRHSDKCLTTRFMWRTGGAGEIYAYMPSDQVSNFCHAKDIECNSEYGASLGRGSWTFKTGHWETIAQHIKLNTPGHKDGSAIVWHNGKKVYELHNINFRSHSNLKLEGLFFSVFFGGSGSSWAATSDSSIYFRNFILSTSGSHPPHLVG